jgi:hypothetical protein
LIGRSGDGSHAAVVVIFGLQFGRASRLVRKAGEWIEASQVATVTAEEAEAIALRLVTPGRQKS